MRDERLLLSEGIPQRSDPGRLALAQPTAAEAKWHHRHRKYTKTGRWLIATTYVLAAIWAVSVMVFHGNGTDRRHAPAYWDDLIWLLLIARLAVSAVANRFTCPPAGKATKADFALVEDPEAPIWVVELEIHGDSIRVGRDRGVMGFHNRALFFNGRCCSFQIGTQDVDNASQAYTVSKNGLNQAVRSLGLANRRGFLSLEVLEHPAWKLDDHEKEFDDRMQEFVKGPPTTEPRSLPPLERPSRRLPDWRS